jgi:hypothetical protein
MKTKDTPKIPMPRIAFWAPLLLIVLWFGLKFSIMPFPSVSFSPVLYPFALFMTSDIQWLILGGLAVLLIGLHGWALKKGAYPGLVSRSLILQASLLAIAFAVFFSGHHVRWVRSFSGDDKAYDLVELVTASYSQHVYAVMTCPSNGLICDTYATVSFKGFAARCTTNTRLESHPTESGFTLFLGESTVDLEAGEEIQTLCGLYMR